MSIQDAQDVLAQVDGDYNDELDAFVNVRRIGTDRLEVELDYQGGSPEVYDVQIVRRP